MAVYLPLALTCAAFVLHLLGERRAALLTGRPRDRRARGRAVAFYAGLATTAVALAPPIDAFAQKLLWVHMIQHMLLLTVAAPLIVLGVPWLSLWRPLPLGFRRRVARAVYCSPRFAPVRALARALATPLGAWLVFTAGLYAWHLPAAYDLALRSASVHALEHLTFMACGIMFWAQVTASPPAGNPLSPLARTAYVLAGSATNVVLAAVLAFSPDALYPYYVHLLNRPGGISALADQQIAAGIMWSAGDLPFGIAIAWLAHGWLSEHEARTRAFGEPVPLPVAGARKPT
ncbi:MAG: cytochrome c oxidase assembly protein [Solirubrobacteraceae bacterium]|jgi:cytochrome c oxidase assembly factor CtaG